MLSFKQKVTGKRNNDDIIIVVIIVTVVVAEVVRSRVRVSKSNGNSSGDRE